MPRSKTEYQTVSSKEFLQETLCTLNKMESAVQKTLDTPHKAFSESCREEGLNWKLVRVVFLTQGFQKAVVSDKITLLKQPDEFDLAGYERLYCDIFNINDKDISKVVFPSDYEESVSYVVNRLPERKKKVISMYYGVDTADNYSITEIAQELNITIERVRQILSNSLRILRSPNNSDILRFGLAKWNEMRAEVDKQRQNLAKQEMEKRKTAENDAKERIMASLSVPLLERDVNTLNLSPRTCNLLKRNKIYTIENLINTDRHVLANLRDMGRKSMDEINRIINEIVESPMNSFESATPLLDKDIGILEFSIRTHNALKRANINTIGDLITIDRYKLSRTRNLGQKSLDEIDCKLKELLKLPSDCA